MKTTTFGFLFRNCTWRRKQSRCILTATTFYWSQAVFFLNVSKAFFFLFFFLLHLVELAIDTVYRSSSAILLDTLIIIIYRRTRWNDYKTIFNPIFLFSFRFFFFFLYPCRSTIRNLDPCREYIMTIRQQYVISNMIYNKWDTRLRILQDKMLCLIHTDKLEDTVATSYYRFYNTNGWRVINSFFFVSTT
jgi:hypothetical protein